MTDRVPMQPLTTEPPPGLSQLGNGQHRDRRSHRDGNENRVGNVPWKERPSYKGGEHEDASRRVFQPYHSMSVPKKRDLEVSYTAQQAATTVMLRNIPNKYTQASLLQEIDAMGFASRYNFFYLPMDVVNRTNVGYAFINFVTPSDMQAFFQHFTDYKFRRHQSQKIAKVSIAHNQGFLENVCHYSNCAVTRSRNNQYRPLVLHHGRLRDLAEILQEMTPSRSGDRESRSLDTDVLRSLQLGCAVGSKPDAAASSGLNPDAAEFIPAPRVTQASPALISPAAGGLDPSAKEFVPASTLSTSPAAFQVPKSESFSQARKGLEEAVSMLLAGAQAPDSQSTEGGESGAGSSGSHDSPRSGSDKEAATAASLNKSDGHDILGVARTTVSVTCSKTILGNSSVGEIIGAR